MSESPSGIPETKADTPLPSTSDDQAAAHTSAWETVAPSHSQPPLVHLHGEPSSTHASSKSNHGRYEVLGEIARGGMGAVLKGRDSELNRDLAIKVLLEKYRNDSVVLHRFFEEAQIGGQLQHPGIVPIYDLGVFPDKRPFFAMKLVKGRTLASMLAERPPRVVLEGESTDERRLKAAHDDLPRFLAIFEYVSQTIAYAHSKKVIHRDLKPLNIMVGAFGEVQVMDWGLAKVLGTNQGHEDAPADQTMVTVIETARRQSDSEATIAGSRMGTPAYMAPEQARGEIDQVDERADVFGLGAILCEILTGQPAYTGRNQAEVVRKAEFADLDDARARLDSCGADAELIALAKACLARDPAARPPDASAVASQMSSYLAGMQERLKEAEIAQAESAAKADAQAAQALAERAKRKMTVAVATSILLTGAIGGGSFLAYELNRKNQRTEADRTVSIALSASQTLKEEAEKAGPGATVAWKRALDAAEKAHYTATLEPISPALAQVERKVYIEIANSEAAAQERARISALNQLLDRRLDEARLQGMSLAAEEFDTDAKVRAYAEAFQEAGLAIGQHSPSEIIARLKDDSQVTCIGAALDDWTDDPSSKPIRADLVAIAEGIDPAHNNLRRALREGDHEAIVRLTRGQASRDLAPASAVNVAIALKKFGLMQEAKHVLGEAYLRYPNDFWLNHELGMYSMNSNPPHMDRAVRFFAIDVALNPQSPGAWFHLGLGLANHNEPDDAARAYAEAIRHKPDFSQAHSNLASVLNRLGRFVDGEKSSRQALRYSPNLALAHNNLGINLRDQGKLGDAEEALREAMRRRPNLPQPHFNLADVLRLTGRHSEADTAYRKAIKLKPDAVIPYNGLGLNQLDLDMPQAAEQSFQQAIHLAPASAEAHYNLGISLRNQMRFSDALKELHLAHAQSANRTYWPNPSERMIRETETLIELEKQIPSLIRGESSPKDTRERLALAQLCHDIKHFSAAVQFLSDALTSNPQLGDSQRDQLRYHAARSALMAGTSQDKSIAQSNELTRATLRRQAHDWLRADFEAWSKYAQEPTGENRDPVIRYFAQWRISSDLASVRTPKELDKLPIDERKAWESLWADVDALLQKVSKMEPKE